MDSNSKKLTGLGALALVSVLAACGGGGGGGGGTVTPPTTQPTSTPTLSPTLTNASGTVVDDGTGSPIAGARVVLMPWGPCGATPVPASSVTPENDGCPTPLPAPQATTDASGRFTLNGAPNGHYLLVIGSDSTSTTGTVQATVHDNVTLNGGNQTLAAPTIPPLPTVTPKTWETNGDYRIATLDATAEVPCLQSWNQHRIAAGVAASTTDEWLIEQVRAVNAARAGGGIPANPVTVSGAHLLTTSNVGYDGAGSCDSALINSGAFGGALPASTDPRTLWTGATVMQISPGGATQNLGVGEFPIDPRSFTDPNVPNWL